MVACRLFSFQKLWTQVYWGNIGIIENKIETSIVYWVKTGIMENKMETTIVYSGKGASKYALTQIIGPMLLHR